MELPRLVALTPGRTRESDVPRLLAALGRSVEAGLPGLLLRETLLPDRVFLDLARAAREILGPRWLAVHDRVHLAEAVRADAVHLGFRSLAASTVRARFGTRFRLGVSTHAGDPPPEAADYALHGPVKRTASKPEGTPGYREPIGFEGLARASDSYGLPVLGLGGLGPEDGARALSSGAHGIAVLAGILGAHDPAAATHRYLAGLDEAEPDGGSNA